MERTGQSLVVAPEVVAGEEVAFVQDLAKLLQQLQRKLHVVSLAVRRLDLRQRMLPVEEPQRVRRLGAETQDLVAEVLRVADAEVLPPLLGGDREDVDVTKTRPHGGVSVAHGNRL